MNQLLSNLSLFTIAIAILEMTLEGFFIATYAETLNYQDSVNDELLDQISDYSQKSVPDEINQITNVNQLQDVSPTDWSY